RVSLAAGMFLLALATKQTFLVAPIAVACALWPCRARLARFAAILAGGSVVGIGIAQWLTGGWFLWHTVTANSNEPDLDTFAMLIAVPAYQATAVQAAENLIEASRPAGPHYLSLVADRGAAPYRVDTAFIADIAREPGDLLTDNSGLAVAAGKRIAYEFQIFQLLNVEGYWSDRPILDAVAARRFSLVAVMHPLEGPAQGTRWTATLRDAL